MDESEGAPEQARWTKEQVEALFAQFKANQATTCPRCAQPLLVQESDGLNRGTRTFSFVCLACEVGASAPFFRWDPNIFIRPPYIKCPKCGQAEFGVLMIHGDNYTRRCRNRDCRHDESYRLPRRKKAVIYLDQHIISDMMKALNPAVRSESRKRAAYARRVFEVLDRAVKLQLVICPDSAIHTKESMVAPDFNALRRMYEQLSNKVSFREVWDIKIAQVHAHARNWLRGEPSKPLPLDAQNIVHGDLHGWHDHLMIGVGYAPGEDTVAKVRSRRALTFDGLTREYSHWASLSQVNFDVYRSEMVAAFGHGVVTEYPAYWERRRGIEAGVIQPTEDDLEPPLCVRLLHGTAGVFQREGLTRPDAEARSLTYFKHGDHSAIPFVRVSSLLSAALAWQFAHGRTRELGQGTTNDLSAIAHFLPYCDAMYVDNEMSALVHDRRVARELNCDALVFSRKTCDGFIAHVEGLIEHASPQHLARVRHVYGETAGEPLVSMYATRDE